MKNSIKILVVMVLISFASCKDNTTETKAMDATENIEEKLYSCPMHPEVTGKQDDDCSKCGMKLTQEVK
ncbi:heavy metal-binding domain-containing protein [Flavobacterium sp. NG2]|uniref:heavy metal-binding domain-containing protein n=1 Tax=Flavobacterium sp. NG2 TaxID=3097547 RepID=UPI002A82E1E0|nr:heavy metal-binding domain-containing protein [Flavobacterium sp. NG2]WPR72753.1 heavy metal-binding domain-containing protein [Flavobacterium sp. NG2]